MTQETTPGDAAAELFEKFKHLGAYVSVGGNGKGEFKIAIYVKEKTAIPPFKDGYKGYEVEIIQTRIITPVNK